MSNQVPISINRAKAKVAKQTTTLKSVQQQIIELANLRDTKNAAETKAKEVQKLALQGLGVVGSESLVVVDVEHSRSLKATIVRGTQTTLNEDEFLDSLTAEQRQAVVTPRLDQEKLLVMINAGLITHDQLSKFTDVDDKAPYIKITPRGLTATDTE